MRVSSMQKVYIAASRTCFGIAKGETSPLLDSKGKAFAGVGQSSIKTWHVKIEEIKIYEKRAFLFNKIFIK